MKKLLLILLAVMLSFTFIACEPEADEPVKYTVSFDLNYEGATDPTTEKVEEGKTVAEPNPKPTREHYTFDGWTLDGDDYDFTTKVTEDITLKATWTAVKYEVKYMNGDVQEGETLEVEAGEITLIATPENDDITVVFGGWKADDEAGTILDAEGTYDVSADVTFTAVWVTEVSTLDELNAAITEAKPYIRLSADITSASYIIFRANANFDITTSIDLNG